MHNILPPLNAFMDEARCFPLDTAEELLLSTQDALRSEGIEASAAVRAEYMNVGYAISTEMILRAVAALLYYGEGDTCWSDAMAHYHSDGQEEAGEWYEHQYKLLREDNLFEIIKQPALGEVRYSHLVRE